MTKLHDFEATVRWTGNRGEGTRTYRGYDRTWALETEGKARVDCSNDPLLGGDPRKHNPEDLLVASLSACHMLWYLHLASSAGIAVQSYRDDPLGHGETTADGAGRFLSATLRPTIEVPRGTDLTRAEEIHHEIHRFCFLARSVNFPIAVEARFIEV